MTSEANIRDIERHCNNYFNPHNDPAAERDHPPEFLELADRILAFRENTATQNGYTSEMVVGLHQWSKAVTASGVPAGWQAIFAADLAVYKRIRVI